MTNLYVCSPTEVPSQLIDGIIETIGNVDADFSPWYILSFRAPAPSITKVTLHPRKDSRWRELSNVTVSLSNATAVGDPAAQVCATGVSAAAAVQAVEVACPGTGTWRYVHLQRYSNGVPVSFGLAEVQVLAAGERSSGGWTLYSELCGGRLPSMQRRELDSPTPPLFA